MKKVPHNRPSLGKEEAAAAARVIRSGWVAEGGEVAAFENEICKFVGLPKGHAAALSSGTAALYLALRAIGVTRDDEVILPTYVCSATLNAVFAAGAKPVLADIDPLDLNLSAESARKKVSKKTKAIIVTHTFGMPADMKAIRRLGVPIIEDCAVALGSKIGNKHVGTFGEAAVFSFYASKIITTGYGGMVISKNKRFIEKVRDYREFDMRKSYTPRFNFLLSDVNAAVGRVQLKKLPRFLKKRASMAAAYYRALPREVVWPHREGLRGRKINFHRFLIRTKAPRRLQKFLKARGIQTIIPTEPWELLHRYLKQSPKRFPVSEEVARTTLSLPIHPSLSSAEVRRISAALKEAVHKKLV